MVKKQKQGKQKEAKPRPKTDFKKLKKRVFIALVILIAFLVVYSVWFLFFYTKPCPDGDCFYKSMVEAKRASWVKQDELATWLYTIQGTRGEYSIIEVRLLEIKEGTEEIEVLRDKKMVCSVMRGDTRPPEQDLSQCNGRLKEEIQEILIQRMHNYLLQNVGQIKQEFVGF
jgi:hypothetical protein